MTPVYAIRVQIHRGLITEPTVDEVVEYPSWEAVQLRLPRFIEAMESTTATCWKLETLDSTHEKPIETYSSDDQYGADPGIPEGMPRWLWSECVSEPVVILHKPRIVLGIHGCQEAPIDTDEWRAWFVSNPKGYGASNRPVYTNPESIIRKAMKSGGHRKALKRILDRVVA